MLPSVSSCSPGGVSTAPCAQREMLSWNTLSRRMSYSVNTESQCLLSLSKRRGALVASRAGGTLAAPPDGGSELYQAHINADNDSASTAVLNIGRSARFKGRLSRLRGSVRKSMVPPKPAAQPQLQHRVMPATSLAAASVAPPRAGWQTGSFFMGVLISVAAQLVLTWLTRQRWAHATMDMLDLRRRSGFEASASSVQDNRAMGLAARHVHRSLPEVVAATTATANVTAAANRAAAWGPYDQQAEAGESVEWFNMCWRKIWRVYQRGLEQWVIELLQPVFDGIVRDGQVPKLLQRLRIVELTLDHTAPTFSNMRRRVSRKDSDLNCVVDVRYSGGARMLLMLEIGEGRWRFKVPVLVSDLDLECQLWLKIRLAPMSPFFGSISVAFVGPPNIKLQLSPYNRVRLMRVPVVQNFVRKLLTEDLPDIMVLPRRLEVNIPPAVTSIAEAAVGRDAIMRAVASAVLQADALEPALLAALPLGPQKPAGGVSLPDMFVGELTVALREARDLPVWGFPGQSNPYCRITLGEQVWQSRRDGDTSHPGRYREPVWNQEAEFLVIDPSTQVLDILIKDRQLTGRTEVGRASFRLADLPPGGHASLWLPVQPLLPGQPVEGELLVDLTYKPYDDDEQDVANREAEPYSSTLPPQSEPITDVRSAAAASSRAAVAAHAAMGAVAMTKAAAARAAARATKVAQAAAAAAGYPRGRSAGADAVDVTATTVAVMAARDKAQAGRTGQTAAQQRTLDVRGQASAQQQAGNDLGGYRIQGVDGQLPSDVQQHFIGEVQAAAAAAAEQAEQAAVPAAIARAGRESAEAEAPAHLDSTAGAHFSSNAKGATLQVSPLGGSSTPLQSDLGSGGASDRDTLTSGRLGLDTGESLLPPLVDPAEKAEDERMLQGVADELRAKGFPATSDSSALDDTSQEVHLQRNEQLPVQGYDHNSSHRDDLPALCPERIGCGVEQLQYQRTLQQAAAEALSTHQPAVMQSTKPPAGQGQFSAGTAVILKEPLPRYVPGPANEQEPSYGVAPHPELLSSNPQNRTVASSSDSTDVAAQRLEAPYSLQATVPASAAAPLVITPPLVPRPSPPPSTSGSSASVRIPATSFPASAPPSPALHQRAPLPLHSAKQQQTTATSPVPRGLGLSGVVQHGRVSWRGRHGLPGRGRFQPPVPFGGPFNLVGRWDAFSNATNELAQGTLNRFAKPKTEVELEAEAMAADAVATAGLVDAQHDTVAGAGASSNTSDSGVPWWLQAAGKLPWRGPSSRADLSADSSVDIPNVAEEVVEPAPARLTEASRRQWWEFWRQQEAASAVEQASSSQAPSSSLPSATSTQSAQLARNIAGEDRPWWKFWDQSDKLGSEVPEDRWAGLAPGERPVENIYIPDDLPIEEIAREVARLKEATWVAKEEGEDGTNQVRDSERDRNSAWIKLLCFLIALATSLLGLVAWRLEQLPPTRSTTRLTEIEQALQQVEQQQQQLQLGDEEDEDDNDEEDSSVILLQKGAGVASPAATMPSPVAAPSLLGVKTQPVEFGTVRLKWQQQQQQAMPLPSLVNPLQPQKLGTQHLPSARLVGQTQQAQQHAQQAQEALQLQQARHQADQVQHETQQALKVQQQAQQADSQLQQQPAVAGHAHPTGPMPGMLPPLATASAVMYIILMLQHMLLQ